MKLLKDVIAPSICQFREGKVVLQGEKVVLVETRNHHTRIVTFQHILESLLHALEREDRELFKEKRAVRTREETATPY